MNNENNENNEMNNFEQSPAPVVGTEQPEATTPIAPQVNETPQETVVQVQQEPVVPQPENVVAQVENVQQTTQVENPQVLQTDGVTPTPEEPKKKSNLLLIIIIVAVLAAAGVGVFFMLNRSDDEGTKDDDNNNTPVTQPTSTVSSDFLLLANQYVEAVDNLWKNDNMVCQDAVDQTKTVKPSELSSTDAYEGSAYYYVFIDTDSQDEIKLGVTSDKKVAGWVRIGKTDNSYYIALSDGTNYIVDRGTQFGVKYSDLTNNNVITTGNGYNYQYKNGEIFGSNTEGNGWGIGDYKVLTDGDDTNNGIYMSNGKKDAGWTPFCSNVEE